MDGATSTPPQEAFEPWSGSSGPAPVTWYKAAPIGEDLRIQCVHTPLPSMSYGGTAHGRFAA